MGRRRLNGSGPGKRIAIALMAGLLLLTLVASGVAAASSRLSSVGTPPSSTDLDSTVGASIAVSGEVLPVRLIVVDESGVIREMWSNAPGPDYTLRVRLGHRAGPDLSATDEVMAQYAGIASTIDWDTLGLVFSSVQAGD
ncbi:MAG: hypothetical protein Q8O40_11165 [Chloroflexota bacterium]|nr:hypothetical protein [Chloroflexota bacterium]